MAASISRTVIFDGAIHNKECHTMDDVREQDLELLAEFIMRHGITSFSDFTHVAYGLGSKNSEDAVWLMGLMSDADLQSRLSHLIDLNGKIRTRDDECRERGKEVMEILDELRKYGNRAQARTAEEQSILCAKILRNAAINNIACLWAIEQSD